MSSFALVSLKHFLTSSAVVRLGIRNLGRVNTTANLPEIFRANSSIKNHDDLYRYSIENSEEFWGKLARSRLTWEKDFDKVLKGDFGGTQKLEWFSGGRINVSVNCVDRHAKKNPENVALIWEKDEPGQQEKITFRQLSKMVNQLANVLKGHDVKKGDRVALYLPTSPLAVAAMLACARIGAVHSVVFAGFSAEALASRINDAGAEVVITVDQAVRGGKTIDLKDTVDKVISSCPSVRRVFVGHRTGSSVNQGPKDVHLEDEMAKADSECVPVSLDSEDTLFMLYTSGSTGKPKGIVHSQAGYLLYAAVTHALAFDCQDGDIFGCVADVGWITGHSYIVYGPLCNGVTSVLFESSPTYPDPGRYWETVQRLKLTHFYGAPTAIRLLIKHGDKWVKKYDRSSLRVLGSVGEPLNKEAWMWYNNVVGERRCTLIDTWWQTETGGICISPRPASSGAEILPAMPMRPMLGIEPVLLDNDGKELKGNSVSGTLCLKKPWPGVARTIYGDHDRFLDTYFKQYPGYYLTGDGASREENGYYAMSGRIDDVINISGHRLGTAEIECALSTHAAVAESAVVGFPHEMKGEGLYAFVILKDEDQSSERVGDEQVVGELRSLIKGKVASYAVPDFILVCDGLPKTRSGKIMRRILRQIAANDTTNLGDTSTLAEPWIVGHLVSENEKIRKRHKSKL